MSFQEEPIAPETAGIEEVVTTLTTAEPQLDDFNEGLENKISETPRRKKKTCKPNHVNSSLSDQPTVKSKVKVVAEPIPQLPCEPLDQSSTKQPVAKSFTKPFIKPVQVPKCSNIPSNLIYPLSDPLMPLDPNNSDDVRRSIRKRKRSVRAPSPESILRGSSSFHFISHGSLLQQDDPPVIIKTEPVDDESIESSELVQESSVKNIKEEPLDMQAAFDASSSLCVKLERLKLPPKSPRLSIVSLQGKVEFCSGA